MSPTIRSKGGQPLFIGGQVAGADSCCCENPPEVCYCPEWCQYKIEVVSPSSVKLATDFNCFGDYKYVFSQPSSIASVLDQYPGEEDCPGEASGTNLLPCGDSAYVQNYHAWVNAPGLFANAGTSVIKRLNINSIYGTKAQIGYNARISCSGDSVGHGAGMRLVIGAAVLVSSYESLSPSFFYYTFLTKTVDVGSQECRRIGGRYCGAQNDLLEQNGRQRHIQTPLEFTVSIPNTSFGDYDEQGFAFQNHGPYQDLLQKVTDAGFSATFRVTSRPSCREAGCTCGPELYGLQLTLGYFTATIGEYFFFENDATYRMSSALQNNGWSIVLWEKDSEWRFTKMRRVDLYCNSSSGSPTWYAYIRTRCIEYDNEGRSIHDSTDSWMGTIDCYESCEFSADDSGGLPRSRAVGDSIPLGDVQNVEYLGRENGQPECDPPDLPVVRIGQSETC
jgi:hypothetical protein